MGAAKSGGKTASGSLSLQIQTARLANGLTLILDPVHEVETCAVGLWCDVGSRDEDQTEHGLCHLLEHMAFKGTQTRSARAIAEAIENVGGTMNAATGFERTGYFMRVLKDDLALAIELLGDIVLEPAFAADEFEREKSVVIQEIGESSEIPEDLVFDAVQARSFAEHPLGRPILGTKSSVRGHARDSLLAFASRTMRAGSAALVIAGRAEMDAVRDLVEARFQDFPSGARPLRKDARHAGGLEAVEKPFEQAHLGVAWPTVGGSSGDRFAARLLSEIYGGGMSSRLFQEARENRGLCYSIYACFDAFAETGLLGFYAATDPEDVEALVGVAREQLASLSEGPTDAELARAKAQLKAALAMSQESLPARAESAASQFLRQGEVYSVATLVARVEAVERADVARLAAQALVSTPSVGVAGPDAALVRDRVAGAL